MTGIVINMSPRISVKPSRMSSGVWAPFRYSSAIKELANAAWKGRDNNGGLFGKWLSRNVNRKQLAGRKITDSWLSVSFHEILNNVDSIPKTDTLLPIVIILPDIVIEIIHCDFRNIY